MAGTATPRDIIVAGASAGGVESLGAFVADLPASLPASLFVVLHVPAGARSVMPEILERRGVFPAQHAVDGEEIRRGRIYVAPPDAHLLVKRGSVRLSYGPRQNGHRPAVDPLFRSAANAYGPRVIGVILSGSMDDGTAGLAYIRSRGGTTVALDPDDALYPGMASSAIDAMVIDHVVPLDKLGEVIDRLAREEVLEERSRDMEEAPDIVESDPILEGARAAGTPSDLSCPECSGALYEEETGSVVRFRCHVGHSFSTESLVASQSEALEAALWTALRTLEESALLAHCMSHRMANRGSDSGAERFADREADLRGRAAVVRGALLDREPGPRGVEPLENEESLRETS